MALTIDGNDLVFTGDLRVTNFTSPTNGVCTLVLTPSGGVGTLPALLAGTPGLPPTLTVGTVNTLSAGAQATVAFSTTNAGGPGVASQITVDFGIPQGVQGASATHTIGGSSDLSGTPVVADFPYVSGVTSGTPAFSYTPFPFGVVINPTTISTLSLSGIATGTLCTVNIGAQSHPYVPLVFAGATSVGTANTVINLIASVNPGTGAQTVGTDWGLSGVATQKLKIEPSFASLIGSGSPAFGEVPANTAATITVQLQQTANVLDSWSVSNTTASCTVVLVPIGF